MGNKNGGEGPNPGYYIESGRKISHKSIKEDDFVKLKLIGKGHFSRVLLVQKKDNKKFYAMKIMQKEKIIEMDDIENIRTERVVLECFSHPYIVTLHYAFQTPTHLFLVMDFVNGGELYYHLVQERRFNEERVKVYCAEIFCALEYLHEHKIIYRDLKLENVLLDREGHCVLTDFNFSKIITEDVRATTFCGTVDYIAPEVLLAEENRGKGYDYSVDWWSLGILCYELIFGLPPFYSTDVTEAYTNILSKPLTFPRRPEISREGRDFIKKMLVRNPKKRLGCKNSKDVSSHPWFDDLDFKGIISRRLKPKYVPTISGPDDVRYVDMEFLSQPVEESPMEVKYDPKMMSLMQKEFVGFSFSESPPVKGSSSTSQQAENPLNITPTTPTTPIGGNVTPTKGVEGTTPPLSPIRGVGSDGEKPYSHSPQRFDRMIAIDYSQNSPPRMLYPPNGPHNAPLPLVSKKLNLGPSKKKKGGTGSGQKKKKGLKKANSKGNIKKSNSKGNMKKTNSKGNMKKSNSKGNVKKNDGKKKANRKKKGKSKGGKKVQNRGSGNTRFK